MPGNLSVNRVLEDTQVLINAWKSNLDFQIAGLSWEELEKDVSEIRSDDAQIESLRSQLTLILEKRDHKVRNLSGKNTRTRSGFRAVYGPDSPQYKQAGGTPTSERKAPRRKLKSE